MLHDRTFRRSVLFAVLTCSLGLGGCDNSKPQAGADADDGAAKAASDASADVGTAERIKASQERVGLDTTHLDQPSHHLTEYHARFKPGKNGPHGGSLVNLGGQAALELKLNRDAGRLTMYVLDATGDTPQPLAQGKVRGSLYYPGDSATFDPAAEPDVLLLFLAEGAQSLDDVPEQAHTFTTTDRDIARRPPVFVVKLQNLKVGEQTFEELGFYFPEGTPLETVEKAADAQ